MVTKENKNLLFRDLCGRLPYGVKVKISDEDILLVDSEKGTLDGKETMSDDNFVIKCDKDSWVISCDGFKPYLRPMSSMTEEERREYDKLIAKCIYDPEAYFFDNHDRLYDWLLSHYLDYCGLIEKGLAIKAPDGMYK